MELPDGERIALKPTNLTAADGRGGDAPAEAQRGGGGFGAGGNGRVRDGVVGGGSSLQHLFFILDRLMVAMVRLQVYTDHLSASLWAVLVAVA